MIRLLKFNWFSKKIVWRKRMNNDIKQILLRYFVSMALFVIFIIILFSFFFLNVKQLETEESRTENLEQIMNFLETTQQQTKVEVDELYRNPIFRNNFSDYLMLPTNQYVEQNLSQGLGSKYIEKSFQNILANSNTLIGITAYVNSERLFQLQKKPKIHTWLTTKNITYLINQTEDYKNVLLYFYYDLNNLSLKVSNDSFHYVIRNMDNDVSLGVVNKEEYQYENTIEYQNVRILVYRNKAGSLFIAAKIFGTAIIIIILFLITIWFSLQFSFRSYLQQYNSIMNRLKNNSSRTTDFETIEISGKEGDLQRIAHEINESIIKREELIKSEYQNILLQERVELSNLQHQIDPHFLFNNLEFIRMKAFLKNDYEISQFIFEVSQLYRYSLSKAAVISLDEEISMMRTYLNIYKTRDDGNIHFKIDNQISELNVPKFSLQPFVENYIKYGVQKNSKNYLLIKCLELDNRYIFSFLDNGKGTTIETLQEIYRKIEEKSHLEKSIGIANSIKRLKLFYKTQVDYEIKNIPNHGFFVKITIFKMKNV